MPLEDPKNSIQSLFEWFRNGPETVQDARAKIDELTANGTKSSESLGNRKRKDLEKQERTILFWKIRSRLLPFVGVITMLVAGASTLMSSRSDVTAGKDMTETSDTKTSRSPQDTNRLSYSGPLGLEQPKCEGDDLPNMPVTVESLPEVPFDVEFLDCTNSDLGDFEYSPQTIDRVEREGLSEWSDSEKEQVKKVIALCGPLIAEIIGRSPEGRLSMIKVGSNQLVRGTPAGFDRRHSIITRAKGVKELQLLVHELTHWYLGKANADIISMPIEGLAEHISEMVSRSPLVHEHPKLAFVPIHQWNSITLGTIAQQVLPLRNESLHLFPAIHSIRYTAAKQAWSDPRIQPFIQRYIAVVNMPREELSSEDAQFLSEMYARIASVPPFSRVVTPREKPHATIAFATDGSLAIISMKRTDSGKPHSNPAMPPGETVWHEEFEAGNNYTLRLSHGATSEAVPLPVLQLHGSQMLELKHIALILDMTIDDSPQTVFAEILDERGVRVESIQFELKHPQREAWQWGLLKLYYDNPGRAR